MGLITKEFPEIRFFDFPTDRWSKYTYYLNTTLEALPENNEKLFERLVNELLNNKDYWDSDNADEKRTLKMLPKIKKSLEYKKGKGLISLFVYTHSKKGKAISTRIEDSIDIPEYMDSPANADYNQDYVDGKGKARIGDDYFDLIAEGVPCDCIFAVEHKKRSEEPTIQCDHCHGSGVVKCPSCNGSGRESYVDGYYASGEERIKTGACSECGGSGRVPCPECNGKGVIDIFAANYSLVRSVKEIISKRVEGWAILPGERPSSVVSSPVELEHKEFDGTIEGGIDRSYITQAHDALDLVTQKGQFAFLKKNNKSYLEDNRKEIEEIMDEMGLTDKYETTISRAESDLNDVKRQRGEVVSRKEAHFCFPAIILKATYGEYDEAKFILYDQNGKVCVNLVGLQGMSAGDALKNKVLSIFKK